MTRLRILPAGTAALLVLAGVAAGQSAKVTGGSHRSVREQQQDLVDGKKPRVAVGKFENRSGVTRFQDGKHIGDGMEEQLMAVLVESGRFNVMDRHELDRILLEQDYGQSDRFRRAGGSRLGELETVDFLVTGTVTELQQSQSGFGGKVGGRGRRGGRKKFKLDLGELAGGFKRDHIAIELALKDVRTSQVVAMVTVEGAADDIDLSGALGDVGKFLLAGGGHSKTPLQKAVRVCIVKAVDWIAARIEAEGFYRSDESPWEEPTPSESVRPVPPVESVAEVAPAAPPAKFVEAPIALVLVEPRRDAEVLGLVGFGDRLVGDAAQPKIGDWFPVVLADGRKGWVEGVALRD